MSTAIESLKFDEKGLIPAILQDKDTGRVLMFAFMNRESLAKTIETGLCHYWSRSRQKLWLKGETSGHLQRVHSLRTDCDQDVVLIEITQEGVACHDGYRSCFYRKLEANEWKTVDKRDIDPATVYGSKA